MFKKLSADQFNFVLLHHDIFQIWGDQDSLEYAQTLDFLNLVNPLTSISNPQKVNLRCRYKIKVSHCNSPVIFFV